MSSTTTVQTLKLNDVSDRSQRHKVTFHSFRSIGNEDMLNDGVNLHRNHESLLGPSNANDRKIFYICVTILILSGAANDFLGKTIYQVLPGVDNGLKGLINDHWATLCLAICAFSSSSMAIITGRKSFKQMDKTIFKHLIIPSFMDFFVTACRYLALVFLPAAMVTILKSGLQLAFLSIVRRIRGKILGIYQWIGLLIIIIGLSVVSLHCILTNFFTDTPYTVVDTLVGLVIMLFVGVAGAIRNTAEEILLKEHKLDAYFIVGMESLLSLIGALIVGFIILTFEQYQGNVQYSDVFTGIYNTFISFPGILICVICFMTVVYLKDTMQMKVTLMSSAMTRKLFQQLYPIFTFSFSVILYYISNKYGEEWDDYTYIEIIGFFIVLYGAYLYFLEPKYGLPECILTTFGISEANPHASSKDLIDRKQSLLDSDYLMRNGIDTYKDIDINDNHIGDDDINGNELEYQITKV